MSPLVGLPLLSPLSIPYVNNLLRGVYYIPHAAISLTPLGLLVQQAKTQKRKSRIALLYGLCLLSFGAGLGGIRQLFVFHARSSRVHLPGCFADRCWLPALPVLGFLINKVLLSNIYTYEYYMGSLAFTPFNFENIGVIFRDLLAFFGYRIGTVNLQTLSCNFLMCILLGFTLVAVVRFLRSRHSDRFIEHSLLACFLPAGLLLYVLLYAFTNNDYFPTYIIPILIFTFLLIGALLEQLDWKKWIIRVTTVLSTCLLLFCSEATWNSITTGYSIFRRDENMLTELSNGEIEMYVLQDHPNKIDDLYKRLRVKAHSTPKPDGPFFLLFHKLATGYPAIIDSLYSANAVCSTDHFNVYGYDSLTQYDASLLAP